MSEQPGDPAYIEPNEPALQNAPATRSRNVTLVGLIILTVLWLLLLVPASLFAMMSPFAFDSGNTGEAWMVAIILVALPCLLLFSIVLSWITFFLKRYRPAIVIGLLPLLGFLMMVLVFWMFD